VDHRQTSACVCCPPRYADHILRHAFNFDDGSILYGFNNFFVVLFLSGGSKIFSHNLLVTFCGVVIFFGCVWVAQFPCLFRDLFLVGHFCKRIPAVAMDIPYFNNQGTSTTKKESGLPFKSTVVDVEYESEGIMYTV
jgi:hypothetical protein